MVSPLGQLPPSLGQSPSVDLTEAGVGPQLTRVVGVESDSGGPSIPQVPLVPWGSSL